MAFTGFRSIEEIIERYELQYRREVFVRPIPGAEFSPQLRDDLAFTIASVPFERSEVFTREAVIYPILRDVWREYRDTLSLFSGEAVEYDDVLRGEVDYFVCRRSPFGPLVPDRPILLVGEAKRIDLTGGWNQALGGMIAAQKLDGVPGRTYFGLTTTGRAWTFGKLTDQVFTEDPQTFTLLDDRLPAALHYIFAACRDQLLSAPVPAA